tara:strand:+ start:1494 stop:3689 length:2196 start_codon:yes stop_codon:yes gene_type:complete
MIKHKSTLAKLMARENITVQYGNYQTAWFDIKNRVLGLPMWKDMGKDVSDLLIGHEVGHALFTPYEGWHDSPEKLEGCPRSYINVIEDARIERHIKEAYVGLVGPMSRGYKKLFDDGFFGDTDSLEWGNVKLIDKINLHAKVGNLLDVPFTDEEQVYMDRAMKTVTFEDVTDLVRDILAYTKENQEELLNPPPSPQGDLPDDNEEEQQGDDQPQMGHDDMEKSDEEEAQGKSKNKGDNTNTPSDQEEEEAESAAPTQEDVSETDEVFRRKEHTLVDRLESGNQILIGNEFRKEVADKIVTPYAVLAKERKAIMEKYMDALQNYNDSDYYVDKSLDELRYDFKSYIKKVKKDVNFAVKEFEMRKAGYRYTRATVAKTGSIDVNRLWSYKTNEDIFNRVTKLADAKNHGMFMLIDFSGSMNDIMGDVLSQLIHLVVFCKTVNIPFDVYGFTNQNNKLGMVYGSDDYETIYARDSEVNHSGLSLPQLISSTLKKSDYDEALEHLYLRMELCKDRYTYRERYIMSPNEGYGSTPLNEALVHSHKMIDAFKRNNNVDNMNLVVISDGDANGLSVCNDTRLDNKVQVESYAGAIINIMGQNVRMKDTRRRGTESLLNSIEKRFGVTTIGFFLADNGHNFKWKIRDCDTALEYYDNEGMKKYNKEYAKNKCITFKDTLGYNELYIVKSWKHSLSTDVVDFEPDVEATKGQITSQFKKFSKSKKLNKTLLTNFGRAVAE